MHRNGRGSARSLHEDDVTAIVPIARDDGTMTMTTKRYLRKQNGVHENSTAPLAYHDYYEAQYPPAAVASSHPQQHPQPQVTVFGISSGGGSSVHSFKKTASVSGSRQLMSSSIIVLCYWRPINIQCLKNRNNNSHLKLLIQSTSISRNISVG
uniref:Uncharacterized protein n=1 Tax=Glossina brevipalpis TaxID=37001 RepID=A0A1A9X2Q1_9MUSC